VSLPRPRRELLLPLLLFAGVALLVAACSPSGTVPAGSGGVAATASPHPPLTPAQPGADPVSLMAWVFNPIFQVLYILLIWLQKVTGDVGVAIVLMTLIVRAALIPLFRRQIVSTKRMQLVQPELKELQKRYKGDRTKYSQAQMELFKERGVNPASGCLPLLLQLPLLMIIYSVISQGLTNPDPRAMFSFFGLHAVDYTCVNGVGGAVGAAIDLYTPCINTKVAWLGNLDVSKPWVLFPNIAFLSWFSVLAAASAVFQLVQSRMTMPPSTAAFSDQNSKVQRQLVLFLPLISLAYGGFLPAGLFIYWIVTTIFGIVQQYLIVGWGATFPLFGFTPSFARDHRPRFPVEEPKIVIGGAPGAARKPATIRPPTDRTPAARSASAAATVRPRERGRQGRRGRRR
jgi:YidC/Oxa1 family membrane protein insertase